MVLAAGLGHAGFKKWVEEELNGYSAGAELPSYRLVQGVASIGSFAGPLGEQINNVPLALAPIPASIRDRYSRVEFREGVARLEHMAKATAGEEELVLRWPGDLVAAIGTKFIQGRTLMAAHIEIPTSAVVGVLDSVRNRTLKFVLEIEEQAPGAGDVAPGSKPVPVEQVGQIFNTYILGNAQNVAVGSPGALQHARQIVAGDVSALRRFLAEQGVEARDLAGLEQAIAEDGAPKAGQPFGKKVAGWIGNMVSKAASGAWSISTSSAGELLTTAIRAYYGLN